MKVEDTVLVANGGTANRMMGLMRFGDTVIDPYGFQRQMFNGRDSVESRGIEVYKGYGWSLLWLGGYNGGKKY